jgi:phospholipid/cholesterol/gamma-HCH transport system substrate-binding protein
MQMNRVAAVFFSGATTLLAGCSVLPGEASHALGQSIRVTADFENVAGMYPGNSVDVLGMAVGKVDSVDPRGTYVRVTMDIDKDVNVPESAIAALVSPSVVTDRHVELTPPWTGPASGPILRDGDHIPLERTRTPVEIDELISTIDKFAQGLSAEGPAGSPGPLSSRVAYPLLAGHGDELRQTLENLSGALKIGTKDKGAIAGIIVQLNDLTSMLADSDQQVREFSDETTRLSQLLAAQAPGMAAVLDQIDDFLADTSSMLGQHGDQLDGALSRLALTAEQLRRNAGNLTEVVDVAPLLFQNLTDAMAPTDGGVMRLHLLTDKSLIDNEALSLFCERIAMRVDGCRTGKIADFGPDLGLTAALAGISQKWSPR